MQKLQCLVCAIVAMLSAAVVQAEVTLVRVGRTPTLSQLPIYVLEAEKLIEKHTMLAGLGHLEVKYIDVTGGAVLNDMLLSGNLEFATGGVPPFLILWSRSLGTSSEVKAIAAVGGTPSTLYTRNPDVRSVRDLSANDRIAVAGVKASQVAILLQMAAAEAFGQKSYDKLDSLTVTMRDADAVGMLTSGKGELTGHFTYDPYRAAYANKAGMRPILLSRDVLGGVGTVTVAYATTRFHTQNPKIAAAYFAALREADDLIKRDPARAARAFKQITNAGQSEAELEQMIRQPDAQYSLAPVAIGKVASFMAGIGSLKAAPSSWRDLFFSEAHGLPGN